MIDGYFIKSVLTFSLFYLLMLIALAVFALMTGAAGFLVIVLTLLGVLICFYGGIQELFKAIVRGRHK